jgi:hypothetical protein
MLGRMLPRATNSMSADGPIPIASAECGSSLIREGTRMSPLLASKLMGRALTLLHTGGLDVAFLSPSCSEWDGRNDCT